jgi:hypothetical protein
MDEATQTERGRPRFWLLAIAGGIAILAVSAGVYLTVSSLFGRSTEASLSALPIAVIGLGSYIGALRATRRQRGTRP